ncbi:MAG: hypothetical protein K8H86_02100, partial [Ignavibacteriaceae bacterium]|nr:hypothetical protein [Ignavibacteriaceae bacterium]
MRIKKRHCIIISLLFAAAFSAQTINPSFERITVTEGLSQNTVMSIVQDNYGFMWFGTQDGLNRFDGYNFKIFRNKYNVKNSLSNNYIWKVYEDEKGMLWIGTFGGGLNKYDPLKNLFTEFNADAKSKNPLT